MNYSSIQLVFENEIATIYLNRPEVHNAFNATVIAELLDALDKVKKSSARLLVLRANGKNFSAGADLKWMQETAKLSVAENKADAAKLANLMHKLNQFPRPTLAVVQGAAFGGALGLIACCDIAFATVDASFCLSEVKIGLVPAVISPYVVRAIGERASRRYFLSAEKFSAEIAKNLGLIHEIVDKEQLDEKVQQFMQLLLANGPNAQQLAKTLVFKVSKSAVDEDIINYTSKLIAQVRASAEGQEGLSAFFAKREPNWKTQ